TSSSTTWTAWSSRPHARGTAPSSHRCSGRSSPMLPAAVAPPSRSCCRRTRVDDVAEERTLEEIIAERVREYRVAAGISAAELATRTELSKAMISRIEAAATSSSLTTLQRLAKGLGVPVTALFRGADTDREAVFTP